VVGADADGAQALRFDSVALKAGQTLESYVASGWIDGVATAEVQSLTVGGLPAAATSGKGADWTFRLAAIQAGPRVYRFILAAKGQQDPERAMRALLDSFRNLSPSDAQSVSPLRIRLVAAGAGDTPASLAERMASVDRPLEQFLILNGLERGAKLTPGQRYKIVSE
jgi:predicted Zn-dependent protease